MRRVSGFVSLAVCLAVLNHVPVFAQTAAPGFTLEGHVLDAMRAPIAGARVTAVPDTQTSASSTTTDQAGSFTLKLPRGGYTVTAVADGFVEQAFRVDERPDASGTRVLTLGLPGLGEAVTIRG